MRSLGLPNIYVASSSSDAIAIFKRHTRTGKLTQGAGVTGCIAARAAGGCASAVALEGPNSVTVSPDGRNVYVGAFKGSSVAVFARNVSSGALTQPAGPGGCIADTPIAECAPGVTLASPEGMAISPGGENVYVAAALSSALDVFTRNPSTGTLTQAGGGAGCIAQAPLAGCTTGVQLGGADAVAVSPDGADVYVTSVLSDSVTSFARAPSTGLLTQRAGTSARVIYVLAVGCSLGQALAAPEGLAVSPDGANVYATAFASGAIDVLDRSAESGALTQKPRRVGCLAMGVPQTCALGRAVRGASSVAVSPDGRYVYAAAFASSAVSVFKRVAKTTSRRQH